jgi:hypothetical protein
MEIEYDLVDGLDHDSRPTQKKAIPCVYEVCESNLNETAVRKFLSCSSSKIASSQAMSLASFNSQRRQPA